MPDYVPEYLKLEELDSEFTRGVIGRATYEPVFRAFVYIDDYPPHEVKASSLSIPYAVLGRDVLNQYHITLDGPNQSLTITR